MLSDRIRALFRAGATADASTGGSPGAEPADPLQLAACALLLDVAYADGEFSDVERAQIERTLERRFGLPPSGAGQVIALAEAERAHAVDHFAFTSTLLRGYDTAQKVALAEAMWSVALADGEIAEHEHYLTRKIANLLDLEPVHFTAARRAAAERAASTPEEGEPGAG